MEADGRGGGVMAGEEEEFDLGHADAFEEGVYVCCGALGLGLVGLSCVGAQGKIHDGFGLLEVTGTSTLICSKQFRSLVKLL